LTASEALTQWIYLLSISKQVKKMVKKQSWIFHLNSWTKNNSLEFVLSFTWFRVLFNKKEIVHFSNEIVMISFTRFRVFFNLHFYIFCTKKNLLKSWIISYIIPTSWSYAKLLSLNYMFWFAFYFNKWIYLHNFFSSCGIQKSSW